MRIFVALAVLVFSLSAAGFGQAVAPIYIPQADPVAVHLQNMVRQQMAMGDLNRSAAGGRGKGGAAKASGAPAARGLTMFTSSGQDIMPQKLAASMSPKDAANARAMFQMFLANYETTARNDGFPANDLAYGLSFHVVNNYLVYNDLQNKDPREKELMKASGDPLLALQHSYSKQANAVNSTAERAVYEQVKKVLEAAPQTRQMSDREKQEATEMLAILTVGNYYQYEQAGKANDVRAFTKARQAAGESLKKLFGVEPDRIKISAKGVQY